MTLCIVFFVLSLLPVTISYKYFTFSHSVSQYVPTRYKVLCSIDKRCRVRNYVWEVRWYIYTSLRGQVCARVIATPSHNNAQVSAVTVHPPSKASSCELSNGSRNT